MCSSWKKLPPLLRWLLPAAIALLIVWVYVGFALNSMGLLALPVEYWLQFNTTFAIMLVCLGRTMAAQVTLDVAKHVQGDGSIELKYSGEKRFCRKCNVPKPDRTHHCSACGSCIAKMDHHCVFLNKCIGLENYKFFVLFLWWSAVVCLDTAYLTWTHVFGLAFDRLAHDIAARAFQLTSPHTQVVCVFFTSMCVGLALLVFCGMHLVLSMCNLTTLEYCEKRGTIGFVNYYNVGVLSNLHQVFGNWLVACLPIYPAHMTALRQQFPVNVKKFD
ncbi:hypothetical protein, variant [Aphanomyces astaci]|uniref:Palmitoyltransferase n=1 Tax=Aphanomyces astaci TaxID=112090 RepID=W4FXY3_APHAT|nr:hypothetical protein, variant [Aphanomyces astaci]ETV72360.1 hypothetical protein, variant [Aphanomyces astaci]|eukprot:XP_009838042.1 hypothetical protein, variant [Aphanomyces astaci]